MKWMKSHDEFLIVNHVETNIPLEEGAEKVDLSRQFPWFPETIWSPGRAWKNHGHVSSSISARIRMAVVGFHASILLHVDGGATVPPAVKKQWDCHHRGPLVTKLL